MVNNMKLLETKDKNKLELRNVVKIMDSTPLPSL